MAALTVDDRDIRSTVEAFKASATARQPEIPRLRLDRLLLALDGSNQDDTAQGLALEIGRRTGGELRLFRAYEGPAHAGRESYLEHRAAALRDAGVIAQASDAPEGPRTGKPHEQIRSAARAQACGLIVVCTPYQEDLTDLGQESVGSTLDLLLARSEVPVLAVREPKEDPSRCLNRILLPFTPGQRADLDAAAWALLLAPKGADVRVLVLGAGETAAEGDEPQPIPAALNRLGIAGLVAALQRRAAEQGIEGSVELQPGEDVESLAAAANGEEQLVVLPCCPKEPVGASYQRVQALVRSSRNPILVV